MNIPKIFHRIWLGNKSLPLPAYYYESSWKELHPDWEFWFWTNDNLFSLIHQELFDKQENIVAKANMLRVEVLNKFGGVYIDTDFECYKNIEPLIENLEIFSCGEKDGIVGNAIMGSVPNHPTWNKIMNGWDTNMRMHKNYPPNIQTGVVYMTKMVDPEDMTLLPSKYFFPTPVGFISDMHEGSHYPEAYGHHHWAASWTNEETERKWALWCALSGGDEWYK